jgi:hypothetical protein
LIRKALGEAAGLDFVSVWFSYSWIELDTCQRENPQKYDDSEAFDDGPLVDFKLSKRVQEFLRLIFIDVHAVSTVERLDLSTCSSDLLLVSIHRMALVGSDRLF